MLPSGKSGHVSKCLVQLQQPWTKESISETGYTCTACCQGRAPRHSAARAQEMLVAVHPWPWASVCNRMWQTQRPVACHQLRATAAQESWLHRRWHIRRRKEGTEMFLLEGTDTCHRVQLADCFQSTPWRALSKRRPSDVAEEVKVTHEPSSRHLTLRIQGTAPDSFIILQSALLDVKPRNWFIGTLKGALSLLNTLTDQLVQQKGQPSFPEAVHTLYLQIFATYNLIIKHISFITRIQKEIYLLLNSSLRNTHLICTRDPCTQSNATPFIKAHAPLPKQREKH